MRTEEDSKSIYRASRAGSSWPSAGEGDRYWAISRGEVVLWNDGVLDRDARCESLLPSTWDRSRRSVGGLFDADELTEFGVLSSESVSTVSLAPSVCCFSLLAVFGDDSLAIVSWAELSVRFGAASGELAPEEPCLDPNCGDG